MGFRFSVAVLALSFAGLSVAQSSAETYVRAVLTADKATLDKCANDPSAIPGVTFSDEESAGFAKALASSISSFRDNARELLALISPDTPVFGSRSIDPATLRGFLQRYPDSQPIPFSFVEDYNLTLLSKLDTNSRADFGEGQAGAYYVACLTMRLLVTNNALEVLKRDSHVSSKTLSSMVNDSLKAYQDGAVNLPSSLKERTDNTYTTVKPLFDKKLADISAAGEDDGFRLSQAAEKPPVTAPPTTDPVKPPTTDPVKPPTTDPVKPPTTDPVKPPTTDPVKPPTTDPVKPPTTDPVKPPTSVDPVKPTDRGTDRSSGDGAGQAVKVEHNSDADPGKTTSIDPNAPAPNPNTRTAPVPVAKPENPVSMPSQAPNSSQTLLTVFNLLPTNEEFLDLDVKIDKDPTATPFEQAILDALDQLGAMRNGTGLHYPNDVNAFMWARKLAGKTSDWWKASATKALAKSHTSKLLPFVVDPAQKGTTPRAKAITLNQEAVAGWMQNGKTSETIDAFIKAATVDPTYSAPMWNAGLLAASGCNWDYAIKLFTRAVERGLPPTEAAPTKAYIAELKATQNMLTLPDGSQRRLCDEGIEMATFLARSGAYRSALTSAAEVTALDDESPEPFLIAAWIASRNGLNPQAKLCIQEALGRSTNKTSKYISPLFKLLP